MVCEIHAEQQELSLITEVYHKIKWICPGRCLSFCWQ